MKNLQMQSEYFLVFMTNQKIILKSTDIAMNPWKQVIDQLDFIESIVLSLALCKL